jgi:glucose-1-phosphate thymidylyltransferase
MNGARTKEYVGVLPAAGIASRLSPSRYLKELLPVAYLVDDQTSTARPVPVISLSLRALSEAGVQRCVVTISDRKPELMRYLGDGADFQLQLAYVQQSTPSGLAAAVSLATDWVRDSYSCMLLPDTIVNPYKAMRSLREAMDLEELDLVLGVFPTEVPEQLGPVHFDADGYVHEVLDKPASTNIRNTWAMAIWSPAFTELLHQSVASPAGGTQPLGEIFNLAVQKRMHVKAVWFPHGSFVDIGTVKGLSQMVEFSKTWDFPMPATSARGAVAGQ